MAYAGVGDCPTEDSANCRCVRGPSSLRMSSSFCGLREVKMDNTGLSQAGAGTSSLPSSQARDPRRREPAASFFWSLAASCERLQTTQANFCAQAEAPGKRYLYKPASRLE